MDSSEFESEIKKQIEELDQLEAKYDQWENDLDEAELVLFQYQDMIESLNYDDKNIEQVIESLEKNYVMLKKEVDDLEKKYPATNNKTSICSAKEVFNILQKLNAEIDHCKESPFIKTINLGFGQPQLTSETQS